MATYRDTNKPDFRKSLEAYRQRVNALIENPTEQNAVETNIASMNLYDSIYLLSGGNGKVSDWDINLFLQELNIPLQVIEHQERHYRKLLEAERRRYAETPEEKKDPVMRERVRELEITLRNFTSSLVQMRLRGKLLTRAKSKYTSDHH
jgi:hypothetical protein